MPKKKNIVRSSDINSHCNSIANQYLLLVTIFAAIISQEIEEDEDLGVLGSFLITLGEELALASETRIACKSKFENEEYLLNEVEDVFDRGLNNHDSPKKVKSIKKRYIKKVRKIRNK